MKGYWVLVPLFLVLTLFLNNNDRLIVGQIGSVIGIGIDKENGKYKVTIQMANAGVNNAKSRSQLSPITTYDATSNTISNAYQSITNQVAKKLDTSHLQTILLSEDLLKDEGITPTIDFLIRLNKSSIYTPVAIVKNTNATDLMKTYTPIQNYPAMDIRSLLLNIADKNSASVFTSPNNLLTNLFKEGTDIYLPELKVIGDTKEGSKIENIQTTSPSTKIVLNGYTIFHDAKPVNSLSIQEGNTYFLTQGNVKEGILEVNCTNDKTAVLTIENVKSEKKLLKDNSLKLTVQIDGILKENNCAYISQIDRKAKKVLEKRFEKELKKNVDQLVKKSTESNSDFLGLGNTYYIKYPKRYKKVETNLLKKMKVKTSIKVRIQKLGNVNYDPKNIKNEDSINEKNNSN